MFGPTSVRGHRALTTVLAVAGGFAAAAASASAGTVTKTWSGRCATGPSGATATILPASFTFTGSLPDTVRPGSSFGVTNPSLTVTFSPAAVKTLAASGSGITANVQGLWLVTGGTIRPTQTTPDGYNMTPGAGVNSARAPFQTDVVNWFDGTKTTYKGLSLAVTPPSNTSALLASGSYKAEENIATDIVGNFLIDQLFGQAKWAFSCGTGGSVSQYVLGAVAISNTVPTLASISPATGPTAGGNTVTLTGTGLDGTTVLFGKATAGIVSSTPTQLVVRVPAGIAGVVPVTASYAGVVSKSLGYTYANSSTPTITSVSPGTAWEALSAHITLTLSSSAPISGVTFNGTAVNSTVSGSKIEFDAPGLARGTYPIVVTFGNGTKATASFTYTSWT